MSDSNSQSNTSAVGAALAAWQQQLVAGESTPVDGAELDAQALARVAKLQECLLQLEQLRNAEQPNSANTVDFVPSVDSASSFEPASTFANGASTLRPPEGASGAAAKTDNLPSAENTTENESPPSESAAQAQRIGRFEIIRVLGRGGQGLMVLAHDPLLSRNVALKVPWSETLLTPQLRKRFLREAKAVARLTHPHIVAVYEIGEVGPILYIASALIEGPSLAEWLREHGPAADFEVAAELIADLADAMQYAHGQGILHRDLKPANVLLSPKINECSETTSSLRSLTPLIADFGLAKIVDLAGEETRTGAILGTPAYMAPEQARGDHAMIGPSADVYSLAAILYELLTGHAPFQAGSDAELLIKLARDEPAAPRRERPEIPRDLEAICLRGLAKEPSGRYASAGELAADLRRYLTGEPTEARPLSAPRRFARVAKRNPGVTALLATVGVLLLTLTSVSTVAAVRIGRSRDEARDVAASERAAREEVARSLAAEKTAQQTAARERAEAEAQAETAAKVSDFLTNMFMTADPMGSGVFGLNQGVEVGRNLTLRDLLDRGAKQAAQSLESQPITRAALLDTIGRVYSNLGLLQQAEPLVREAYELRLQHPEREQELATSLVNMGNLLRWRGEYKQAEKLLREGLVMQRRATGADSLATAEAEFLLGFEVMEANRVAGWGNEARNREALGLLEHAEAVRKAKLGPTHREVKAAVALQAMALFMIGEQVKAMSRLPAIVTADDEGSAILQLAVTFQRAAQLRKNGKFAQAEPLYRRALEIAETRFGKDHLLTLVMYGDMNGMFRDMGKLDEYDKIAREVVRRAKQAFPLGHPLFIEAINEWLPQLLPLGDYDFELDVLEYRKSLQQRYWAPRDPRNLDYDVVRAGVWVDQGRLAEAERVVEALKKRLDDSGDSDKLADQLQCQIHDLCSAICEQRGDDAGAEQHCRWFLHREFGPGFGITDRLARVMLRLRPDELGSPEEILRRAVPHALINGRHPEIVFYNAHAAEILLSQGKVAEAGAILEPNHKFAHAHIVPGSYYIGLVDSVMGAYRQAIGENEEAENLLLAGYENLRKSRGERHYFTRDAARRLERFYHAQRNAEQEQRFAEIAGRRME